MSDQTVILALPVDGTPMRSVIAGSRQGSCADCGRAVWVSPSSRAILAESGGVVACASCVIRRMADDDAPELQLPTEGQWREIVNHRRRN